ncbi:hypothetical protein J6590_108686 [Homalodisca vitripennis]|nr:hypothetical protein J6590_108686 [Homalodisca vitripennis]
MPRFYIDTMKSTLIRIIKYYRRMKPEIKVAMCFSRYAGIIPSVRRARSADCGRDQCGDRATSMMTKKKEKDTEVTLKGLLQDIVHVVMLFISDLTPQPMSTMMKMASEMWNTTRSMYNSMKQDEMGSCFIDYTSHRFWWWMGI